MSDVNFNDTTSKATVGAAGANTTLSNLTSPTAVNQNLLPGTIGAFSNGTSSSYWFEVYSVQVHARSIYNLYNGATLRSQMNSTNVTMPSGSTAHVSDLLQVLAQNYGLTTFTDNTNNATATGDIYIETGNKTAGTGNTGNIVMQPGTSAGGTRGYVQFNSLVAVLPTGTSDPSTSYPNGSCYYNTSSNAIRVLNGGTWRGIVVI